MTAGGIAVLDVTCAPVILGGDCRRRFCLVRVMAIHTLAAGHREQVIVVNDLRVRV